MKKPITLYDDDLRQLEQYFETIEKSIHSIREVLKSLVTAPEPEPEPEPPVDKREMWHGLWDSWNYSGNEFNTTKVPDPSKAREIDGNVFVSLSHRWKEKTRQQWQAILRGMKSIISDLDPERTIILLQDEPLGHHGFSLEEMQFLYDTAKDLMPDYTFGFSFTRGTVNNKELPICDFILLPAYPFFRSDYPGLRISTKQEFDNWFDSHIAKARAKHSGNIFVIGQGFYNPEAAEDRKRKWRKPPLAAAGWYAEAVQRNNLSGIFWWVYSIDRKDVVGLEGMPEYFGRIMRNIRV